MIQEESAALLSQMFAQQMAGNQSYMDQDRGRGHAGLPHPNPHPHPQSSTVLFDSRALTPPGLYNAQDGTRGGGGGGGSEGGGGSRSSAPNPFENLTGLPFKAQPESGQSAALCCAVPFHCAVLSLMLFCCCCAYLALVMAPSGLECQQQYLAQQCCLCVQMG